MSLLNELEEAGFPAPAHPSRRFLVFYYDFVYKLWEAWEKDFDEAVLRCLK